MWHVFLIIRRREEKGEEELLFFLIQRCNSHIWEIGRDTVKGNTEGKLWGSVPDNQMQVNLLGTQGSWREVYKKITEKGGRNSSLFLSKWYYILSDAFPHPSSVTNYLEWYFSCTWTCTQTHSLIYIYACVVEY